MGRVRDVANRNERLAFDAAELAKQNTDAKAKRDARKAELRAHLDRLALYHENTSHLPAQHKRSRAPEIELKTGDETILAELNSELMAEVTGPADTAAVKAENEQFIDDGTVTGRPKPKAQVKSEAEKQAEVNAKAAATQFLKEEKLYHPSSHNFELLKNYVLEHMPANDTSTEAFLCAFREGFSKLQGKLEQRPQPSAEDRANEYFTKTIHRAEGRDFTANDLDKMDSTTYARVMRIPKRASLGSLLRPQASH